MSPFCHPPPCKSGGWRNWRVLVKVRSQPLRFYVFHSGFVEEPKRILINKRSQYRGSRRMREGGWGAPLQGFSPRLVAIVWVVCYVTRKRRFGTDGHACLSFIRTFVKSRRKIRTIGFQLWATRKDSINGREERGMASVPDTSARMRALSFFYFSM